MSDTSGMTVKTIKIDSDLHEELSRLGSVGMSYSDVIRMLVSEHKEKRGKK